MKYFTLSILFFVFQTMIHAQVKFGKVSKDELKQIQSDIEKNAAAEIISQEIYTSIEYNNSSNTFEVKKNIEKRIKVYDKDKTPEEFLTIEIPLYKYNRGDDEDVISGLKAYTYNIEGNKINETKLNSSDVFTVEAHEFKDNVKFTFPNVKNGSVLEYKYEIYSPDIQSPATWYNQYEIPVKYSIYKIRYPDYFYFRKDLRGEHIPITSTDKKPVNLTTSSFERKNYKSFKKGVTRDHSYTANQDEFIYKNVESLKQEPFVQNKNNLRSSIAYELIQIMIPGQTSKSFSTTWDRIMKDLDFDSNFGTLLKGNNFLKNDVEQFSSISNPFERAQAILSFVQENYNWNQYTGLYPQNKPRKTYQEKTGNSSDINFILIAMLNHAGIKAYPLVLSTVDNGILNVNASLRQLNNTITAVSIQDKIYLMDGSAKFSQIGMLPMRDLNFRGFIIFDKGVYQEVSLNNTLISEKNTEITYEIVDDRILGKMIATKKNYFAMNDLIDRSKDESKWKNDFFSKIDADITNFDFKTNTTGDAIRYILDFEEDKSLQNVGNKLMFNPFLFSATSSNDFNFTNKERKYPLEFGTPFTEIKTIKIKIPDGYVVEVLPEDKTIPLPNKAGGFNIGYKKEGNQIIAQSLIHIAQSVLSQEYYSNVKKMYDGIIAAENENIILRKK